MEVEIKLQLPDAAAHAKVLSMLAPQRKAIYAQRNYFFDSPDGRVSKFRRTLRIRFFDDDKAVLTIKGRQEMKDGVGRATEVEDDLPLDFAKKCLDEPSLLLTSDSQHIQQIKKDADLSELTLLGGFKNNRSVFDWEGYTLEIDETIYSPTDSCPSEDTFYEIELETDDPEAIKGKLGDFLKENGVPYEFSTTTKFGRFRRRAKA
jgi:uncharacterized protein YjbK